MFKVSRSYVNEKNGFKVYYGWLQKEEREKKSNYDNRDSRGLVEKSKEGEIHGIGRNFFGANRKGGVVHNLPSFASRGIRWFDAAVFLFNPLDTFSQSIRGNGHSPRRASPRGARLPSFLSRDKFCGFPWQDSILQKLRSFWQTCNPIDKRIDRPDRFPGILNGPPFQSLFFSFSPPYILCTIIVYFVYVSTSPSLLDFRFQLTKV